MNQFINFLLTYAPGAGIAVVSAALTWALFKLIHRERADELAAAKRRLDELRHEKQRDDDERAEGAGVLVFASGDSRSERHLIDSIARAERSITVFGLTRNFYVSDRLFPLLRKKAFEAPVVLFLMDPECPERAQRYRLEPTEAAMEDVARFRREVEEPLQKLMTKVPPTEAGSTRPGLAVYYYNFLCSHAIEEIDDQIRVMFYGHGVRGTDGPIMVVGRDTHLGRYFASQLRWLERLAMGGDEAGTWSKKGIRIRRLSAPEDHEDACETF